MSAPKCSTFRRPRPTAGGRTLVPGSMPKSHVSGKAKKNRQIHEAFGPASSHGNVRSPICRRLEQRGSAMSEATLFAEALAHIDPAQRAAFLEQACGGDLALRQRVEELLRSHD